MAGIIVKGVKYIYVSNGNNFKNISLEDNVYFTLGDIFMNCSNGDLTNLCNYFINALTGNISFDERKNDFTYSNVLNDKIYIEKLFNFMSKLNKKYSFEFDNIVDDETDMNKYIPFDEWWNNFEKLKILLNEK